MSSLLGRSTRWRIAERDRAAEQRLSRELGVSSLVASLLVQRGYAEPADADRFLHPSLDQLHAPELLPDFEPAMRAILAAKERDELIYVHGDYDVDGVTSAALLTRFLTAIKARVHVHVPHRMKEGYGIHLRAVEEARDLGAKLFLTCDCGGSAIEQIRAANEYGMVAVVTDHHTIGEEKPQAVAFVNPHREDSNYPFEELSGVGVALKLCEGISRELGNKRDHFYRAFLDLAALGTIADVMPLIDENRVIARIGLERLSDTKKVGLQALKREAKLEGSVTSRDVGYILGPRLNASGRIDDAALSLQLLMETDIERAAELAHTIEGINKARREEQERILAEAIEQVEARGLHERSVILVASEGWHAGVIGIVAGRLVEKFRRPSFVFSIDPESQTMKGSARSLPKFHLADAIRAHYDLFLGGGGHAMAAGCSLETQKFDEVFDALDAYASERLTEEDFQAVLGADGEIDPSETTLETVRELSLLEPFGAGNPEPSFVARGVAITGVKPTKNPNVAMVGLAREDGSAISAVAFSGAQTLLESTPERGDFLFAPIADTFNGKTTLKWKVWDFEAV